MQVLSFQQQHPDPFLHYIRFLNIQRLNPKNMSPGNSITPVGFPVERSFGVTT